MTDRSKNKPKLTSFDLFLDINMNHIDFCIDLFRKDIGLRQKTQTKALKLILCNLYKKQDKEIMVSRNKTALAIKKFNPLEVGYRPFIGALDALHKYEWIEQVIGITGKTMTTIKATPKLLQWFEDAGWSNDSINVLVVQLVSLREGHKIGGRSVYIDYEETEYSSWLQNELEKYNKLLNNSQIVFKGINENEDKIFDTLSIPRRFLQHKNIVVKNGEFIFGGRMYGPWIGLSSKERERIYINGEPTIELDRESSHLNAMYQVVTGAPYTGIKPYKVEIEGLVIPRQIIKRFASFMQNGKSPLSTSNSVIRYYKGQSDSTEYEEYLDIKKKVKPTEIVNAILKKHPKIARYYLKGKAYGDYISCWESDIVFEVVVELTRRGIPCLTVYDSFIVPLQYKELVNEMKDKTPYLNRRRLDKVAL